MEGRNESVDVSLAERVARRNGSRPRTGDDEVEVVQVVLLRGAGEDVDDALADEAKLFVAALDEHAPVGDEVTRLLHQASRTHERHVPEVDRDASEEHGGERDGYHERD